MVPNMFEWVFFIYSNMFGTCKVPGCCKPAIGSYWGGSPGVCQEHFDAPKKAEREKKERVYNEALSAIMRKYDCSREAAEIILRKGVL